MTLQLTIQTGKSIQPFQNNVCHELWSPSERVVKRFFNGKWVAPFERMGCEKNREESVLLNPKWIPFTVIMDGQPTVFRADMDILRIPKDRDRVLLVILTYAHQPKILPKEGDKPDGFWNCVSETCIYGYDLTCDGEKTFSLHARNWADLKWFGEDVIQRTFEVQYKYPVTNWIKDREPTRLEVNQTAEYHLKQVWDKVIEPHIQWAHEKKEKNKTKRHYADLSIPFSIGIPSYPVDRFEGKANIESLKGYSPESYWKMKKDKVASGRWYIARLKESLSLRGWELKQFNKECKIGFQKPFQVVEDFHRCLVDVVRVVTMHFSTRPYVTDHKFRMDTNGKPEMVDVDDFRIGLVVPGDCEDGAGGAYQLLLCLLFNETLLGDVSTPEEKEALMNLRKCAVVNGVPVGVSGMSRDPYNKHNAHRSSHMFGAMIPFPIFCSYLLGEAVAEHHMEKTLIPYLCGKYDFTNPRVFEISKKSAVLETTMITTSFYRCRDGVSEGKRKELKQLESLITKQIRENILPWDHLTYMFPLADEKDSYTKNEGGRVHERVIRVFTSAHEEGCFFPEGFWTDNKKELHSSLLIVDPELEYMNVGTIHSFMIAESAKQNKFNLTVLESLFFERVDLDKVNKPTIRLMITVAHDQTSAESEDWLLDNYNRPNIPLEPCEEDFTQVWFESNKMKCKGHAFSEHKEWLKTKLSSVKNNTPAWLKQEDKRMTFFVWVATTDHLRKSVDAFLEGKDYVIRKYGNCHAFIYCI